MAAAVSAGVIFTPRIVDAEEPSENLSVRLHALMENMRTFEEVVEIDGMVD
jgi:hypothetical protein